MDFNISELYQYQEKKEKLKIKAYTKALELCHSKIKTTAKIGLTECWFQVPDLIFGFPLYDIKDCGGWICEELKKNRLKVKFYDPNMLLISWKLTSSEKAQVKSAPKKHT